MEKTPSNVLRIPYVEAIFPESKFLYIIREPFANLSSAELRWQFRSNWHRLWERFKECPKAQVPYHMSRIFVDRYRHYILRKQHFSMWGIRYEGIYNDLKQMSIEEVIAKQWVAGSEQAEEDLAQIDPTKIMRIRYEDFVLNPVEEYQRIVDHFNLTLTDEIKRRIGEMVDPTRQKKWKRLDNDVIKRCMPILKDEMNRHGYETSEIEKALSSFT